MRVGRICRCAEWKHIQGGHMRELSAYSARVGGATM